MKLLFSSFLVLSLFNLCVVLKKNFFFLRILCLSVSYLVNFFKDYKVLLLALKIENFRFFGALSLISQKNPGRKFPSGKSKNLNHLSFPSLLPISSNKALNHLIKDFMKAERPFSSSPNDQFIISVGSPSIGTISPVEGIALRKAG